MGWSSAWFFCQAAAPVGMKRIALHCFDEVSDSGGPQVFDDASVKHAVHVDVVAVFSSGSLHVCGIGDDETPNSHSCAGDN
eukprot:6959909-Pyramimonas_sp.AAC.1